MSATKVRERGRDIQGPSRPELRKQCTVCAPDQPKRVRHDEIWARALAADGPYRVEAPA